MPGVAKFCALNDALHEKATRAAATQTYSRLEFIFRCKVILFPSSLPHAFAIRGWKSGTMPRTRGNAL
jgi:hypothetical protein